MFFLIITVLTAYIVGSIPTGYIIIKRLYGIDIREFGSGNIGATNVKRIAGKKIGVLVQLIDIVKGFVPVFVVSLLYTPLFDVNKDILLASVALSAILGHNFSVFLRFRGGKGVATTAGGFLWLLPIPVFLGFIFYYTTGIKIKIVSVRSMMAGFVIFVSSVMFKADPAFIIMSFIGFALIVARHKSNIVRLLNGTER